jgi:hypothetical protein
MQVVSNSSADMSVITLADAEDLAVVVKPLVPQLVAFRATTFGARASCASLNHLCGSKGVDIGNCTGFPPTFPPVSGVDNGNLGSGDSKLFIQSSNYGSNASCPHISANDVTDDASALNPTCPPPVNAYSLWMQFLWTSEGDDPYGSSPPGSDAVYGWGEKATMLTNCTVSFYNVTLDYRNGSYKLVDEQLSNVGLSDGLAAPTRLGHYASHLLTDVQGLSFLSNNTDEVMAYLNQDLARLAIGSAAAVMNVAADTLSASTLGTVIVGRYPFWPVVIILGLLYTHALLALGIFFMTALFTHTDMVCVAGDPKRVSALELAQLRLTDPLTVVAALFPQGNSTAARGVLSVRADTLDMFDEHPRQEGRIRAGIYSSTDGGDGTFRIWRRGDKSRQDGSME